ncbi:SDR family NAD(P)-dependent oxidoreductase [Rhodophyticola sp.]|jgi:NAD(P)-dependent dehydrogenase (short-subunit alcohol dehydrogenase family)|uniref:SDR family NAD(P)-dependent oxidoreductase n=1 Tax=Rhodophyticola sp. TaxID=2680032 RepID=UPI003D2981E2
MSDRNFPSSVPGQTQDHQPGDEFEVHPEPDYDPRYPGSGRLDGKVVIITGGDSGIGRAVAVLFAREGARVGIVYKDEVADAEETKRLVEREGSEAKLVAGDVGDKSFCQDAVESIVSEFGQLDCLINNAAEQHARDEVEDIPEEQLVRTFRTNIFGQFFCVQAALPHLTEGSTIINTTSVTAYRGQDLLLDYASTKGAILAFTRALSSKLAPKKIRVNGVAPGPIWTPLIPASFPEDKVDAFGTDSPFGRPGQP